MCLIDIFMIVVIIISWIIKGVLLGICLFIAYFLISLSIERVQKLQKHKYE